MTDATPDSAVQFEEIDSDLDGQRIDNFLITRLKGVPRSRVYRILRTGEVRVNGGRIKPSYRLQAGDTVRIPPIRQSGAKIDPGNDKRLFPNVKSRIIYDDPHFLVVNKPSGMAVHGGSGLSFGMIEALRSLYPHTKRLELVHRLDRETSGCLLIAKKTSILRDLHEQIREHRMEKRYLALLKGRLEDKETEVDVPLLKNVTKSGERMVVVSPEGKEARSTFIRQRVFKDVCLAEVDLTTGRTHQIRVHAAHIGHPVIGDEKYGDPEINKQMKGQGCKRLFLHAESLRFVHPATGEDFAIKAKLDEDLVSVVRNLEAG
ncbi:MAG: 23S rRNA pseudouridine(955/2504/2580) synthase RluC [Gammaproteobacteria bacterium]|nr:23S rRNA pseudouridine(955/2504/2580) synthase RluC [Gammaproteobacteria bacterium]